MNIKELSDAIIACYPTRQPLMLWGPPGVGKSDSVRQAHVRLQEHFAKPQPGTPKKVGRGPGGAAPNKGESFDLIDLRLPLLEAIDLRGLPSISNNQTRWIPPSFLPTSGRGILLLDEIPQSAPSMQAAASQLILDRRVGEYTLPDGWHVIGAGNRTSDRAASNAMPTHIANRFIHLYAEVSIDAWVEWALANKIDIRLIAFLKWRAVLLHQFDPQAKVQAFPSPRSWAFVSGLLSQTLPMSLLHNLVKGAVGEGPAGEFIGFLKVFDSMPSIEAILLNPSSAPIPTEMAVLYAVTTSMAARATADNLSRQVVYFNRIKDAGRPEFSVMAMKEIAGADGQREKKITNTRAFMEWASQHSSVLV